MSNDTIKKKIQSSIPELTVGEERKLFNQIRKSAAYITPETLLFNGWTAGGFALTYIIQHHMKRKRKAEEKTNVEENKKPKKTFEDPVTVTSLEDPSKDPSKDTSKDTSKEVKAKPKRKAVKRAADTLENVTLEFKEIDHVSQATNEVKAKKPRVTKKKIGNS